MKGRKVYRDVLNHCYQRTVGRVVLFYTVSDHLVFFTIFCTMAKKYQLQILKLVLMPDHIHQAAIERRKGHLSAFQHDCQMMYAREFNRLSHRKGDLFEHNYGSVPKVGDKKVRSVLIYLDNNPVERNLAPKAESYQWNFLAYGASDHPFSEKIVTRDASAQLKRAMKEVTAMHEAGRYLRYAFLQRLFRSLPDDRERDQLTDFIVVTYSVIDHAASIGCFGRYEDELLAAHATSGSEYDLKETFDGWSDAFYARMTAVLRREGRYKKDIHEILAIPADKRFELFKLLRQETSAPGKQIAKFLHLPLTV